jgi:hypothetical protein
MGRSSSSGEDIAVVLQGTLRNDQPGIAQNALESIRRFLPESQIIVSYPEHDNPEGLLANKFVTYVDPGPDVCFCGKSQMNLSRQIMSMKTGLESVDRSFVLKFRPEFELIGSEFVEERPNGKIRVTNAFTHNIQRDLRYLHVSEVIQFASLDVLLNFWTTSFNSDKIWACGPIRKNSQYSTRSGCSLLRPEQFLTLEYAERVSRESFSSLKAVNTSYSLYSQCSSFLEANFDVMTMTESQIRGPSRFELVSQHSRYSTSWQGQNASILRWLGSLIFWIFSMEGALISIRALVRKTLPSVEDFLSRGLARTRSGFRRLRPGAKEHAESPIAVSLDREPGDS